MAGRLWNVLAGVCALVEAPSAEAAEERLHKALREAGFDPYESPSVAEGLPHAFESEPVDGAEVLR